MIRRVRVRGYKSLRDVELTLRPLTVILGPNASGKSNLLDALGLLSAMVTRPNIKTAFEGHRGLPIEAFFAGGQDIAKLLEKPSLTFDIEVDVELSPETMEYTEKIIGDMRKGLDTDTPASISERAPMKRVTERYLRYFLAVEYLPDSGVLRVQSERLVALNKNGSARKSRRPFFEVKNTRLVLRMEGQAHPTYHELGLPYTLFSLSLYPPHYPHVTAFREELARWGFYYFDPLTMRNETPLKEVDTVGHHGADLAGFFNTLKIKNRRQFDTLCRTLREIVPSAQGIDTERTPEGTVRLMLHENSASYSARVMSEGTLRVLGLLAILESGAPITTLGFEEPENGVHPRRLANIAKLLRNAVSSSGKQIIVTTHSPRLPEYFETQDLVVCQRFEHKSQFRPFHSLGPLFKAQDIESALEERILRGDFGG